MDNSLPHEASCKPPIGPSAPVSFEPSLAIKTHSAAKSKIASLEIPPKTDGRAVPAVLDPTSKDPSWNTNSSHPSKMK